MALFAAGHGQAEDWRDAAAVCLDQLDEGLTGAETLGFVYLTDHFARHAQDILTVLRGRTGIDDWVGTVGIGIVASGAQYFDTPAISVMATDIPRQDYRVFSGPDGEAADFTPWFGVIHGNPQDEELVAAIQNEVSGQGGFWVGGIAASRGTHPMLARGISQAALSGVSFSDAVQVSTALSQGCTPIGPTHEITRSEANLVVELDGGPAFETFKGEIGELLARSLDRIPGFIFAGLPVAGADTDDYLVRDIVGLDPDQGLVAIAAEAEVGDRLMFCRRDGGSAVADMTKMLDRLEKRLDGRQPKGGLYVSCLGRGPAMFSDPDTEVAMIARRFGDMPLTGFFSNGEISNGRLYTYTGVLTLFL